MPRNRANRFAVAGGLMQIALAVASFPAGVRNVHGPRAGDGLSATVAVDRARGLIRQRTGATPPAPFVQKRLSPNTVGTSTSEIERASETLSMPSTRL
ncbi:MAG: hypothetical protein IPK52_27185 [Chloroflexi bacterium]|nr:hypothetical protein [Chloroflexota bacterium]